MKFHVAGKNTSGRAFLVLLLTAAAAFVLPSLTLSAAGDDEFLISLPTDRDENAEWEKKDSGAAQQGKNDAKPQKKPAVQKKPAFQEEDMLQGVVYSLGNYKESKTEGVMSVGRADYSFNPFPVLKPIVLGDWKYTVDSKNVISFPAFDRYESVSSPRYRSFFYRKPNASKQSSSVIRIMNDDLLLPGDVSIYAGYVVAPFTGKFRFVGFGEDGMVVRFNGQIVLDYGYYSVTAGTRFAEHDNFLAVFGGNPQTASQKKMIRSSPLYSQCPLETFFTDYFNGHGVAKGLPVSVTEGQVIPIEIMQYSVNKTSAGAVLMLEYLNADGKPLKTVVDRLPLFCTSEDLPAQTYGELPEFDPDSPVWKVVDAKGNPFPVRGGKRTRPETVSGSADRNQRYYDYESERVSMSIFRSASGKNGNLHGIVYDLKQTRDGKPITDNSSAKDILRKSVQPLLNGTWKKTYAKNGAVQFQDLQKFYVSNHILASTLFAPKEIKSPDAQKLFNGGKAKPTLWVCIFSGYVSPPFSGKFRFTGGADDAMLIRFNNKIVFDYGKVTFTGTGNYYTGVCKANNGADLGQGLPIDVEKGKVYPIEIMVTDLGGSFSLCLYYEKLTSKGEPMKKNAKEFSLFPSPILVEPNQRYMYLNIDPNAPSWKIVNPSDVKTGTKK